MSSDAATTKPPTRAPAWFDKLFEILRVRKVDRVDSNFVKININSDASNASKFLAGLRFLGLIEADGTATAKLDKLRLTGDEFTKSLAEVVRDSYRAVFEQVSVEAAKQHDLENLFIEKYGYSGDAARRATAVFVYLAQKGGIPISQALLSTGPQAEASARPRAIRAPRKPEKQRSDRVGGELAQQQQQQPPPDGIEQLQMGQVRIWLPKGDSAAAETAKSLIDLYLQTINKKPPA